MIFHKSFLPSCNRLTHSRMRNKKNLNLTSSSFPSEEQR